MKEDKASWVSFFQWLRSRGLNGVKLVMGDKRLETVDKVFLDTRYRCCAVRLYRKVFSMTPRSKIKLVSRMLKVIHAQEGKQAIREKAKIVANGPVFGRNM